MEIVLPDGTVRVYEGSVNDEVASSIGERLLRAAKARKVNGSLGFIGADHKNLM